MTTWIGIDPGQRGGLAALDSDGRVLLACPLPIDGTTSLPDARRLRELLLGLPAPRVCALESLRALHGVSSASTWSLASCCGALSAIVALSDCECYQIAPRQWQALLGRGKPPKGLTASQRSQWHKAQSIAHCQRRWPALSLLASPRCTTPHDGLADALCIADALRLLRSASQSDSLIAEL